MDTALRELKILAVKAFITIKFYSKLLLFHFINALAVQHFLNITFLLDWQLQFGDWKNSVC